jgi:hypothetical protein
MSQPGIAQHKRVAVYPSLNKDRDSLESPNFVAYWGKNGGIGSPFYENNLQTFSSKEAQEALNILEKVVRFFSDEVQYNGDLFQQARYKTPVTFYDTWVGAFPDDGASIGMINDSIYGISIGGIGYQSEEYLAHELAHIFQVLVDNPGIDLCSNCAEFDALHEGHADYMAYCYNPAFVYLNPGMDQHSWLRIDPYSRFWFLLFLRDKFGYKFVNKVINEMPPNDNFFRNISTYYKIPVDEVNRLFVEFTSRMVELDFKDKAKFEIAPYAENSDEDQELLFTVPVKKQQRYFVQTTHAKVPEVYGFNVIPLAVKNGQKEVKVRFKGDHKGNYSIRLVGLNDEGEIKYSAIGSGKGKRFKGSLANLPNLQRLALVVTITPPKFQYLPNLDEAIADLEEGETKKKAIEAFYRQKKLLYPFSFKLINAKVKSDALKSDTDPKLQPSLVPTVSLVKETTPQVKISPNPFQGRVSVNFDAPIAKAATFSLVDLLGRMVWSEQRMVQKGSNALDFVLPIELKTGLYFLSADGTKLGKVLKVKGG